MTNPEAVAATTGRTVVEGIQNASYNKRVKDNQLDYTVYSKDEGIKKGATVHMRPGVSYSLG